MFCGTFFVLGMVILMNNHTQAPKENETTITSKFTIKKPKPKPKRKLKRKTKTRRKYTKNRAKPPQINSLISKIKIDSLSINQPFDDRSHNLLGKENDKSLVMTGDVVDKLPQPIERVSPQYPTLARENGITGFVSFLIVIDKEGEVVSSKITESKPPGVFDSAASDAINRWMFKPAIYKGQPQSVRISQTIRFRLK